MHAEVRWFVHQWLKDFSCWNTCWVEVCTVKLLMFTFITSGRSVNSSTASWIVSNSWINPNPPCSPQWADVLLTEMKIQPFKTDGKKKIEIIYFMTMRSSDPCDTTHKNTPLSPCFSEHAVECQLCRTDASTSASAGCLLFCSSQH